MSGEPNLHKVYLSLGANLGDREANIRKAIELIDSRVGTVARQSSLLETAPWGFESDHRFLNAAILCLTDKTPREVLTVTQQIERDMGRRKTEAVSQSAHRIYTDRPIDIDILLYDNLTIDESDLKIPHPLMRQRDFVMIPLQEITNL